MGGKLEQRIREQKEHHELNSDPPDDEDFDGYTDEDAIDDLMDECGFGMRMKNDSVS
jgi:hypothetical protein